MAREAEPDVPQTVQVGPPDHERIYDYDIRPPAVDPSPLHAVAAALAPLSDDLFALSGKQQVQQNTKDAAQADLDFVNKNSQGYAVATQNGLIPPDKSPAYMHQFGANAGLNDASNLTQSIGPDYQNYDKTSDPADFDKWFFSKAKGAADPQLQNNAGYATAYGRGIMDLHTKLSTQFTTDRSSAIHTAAGNEYSSAIGNTINEQWPTGASDLDSQKLAASIGYIRDRAVASGMSQDAANKAAVDMLALRSIDHKNPAALNVLSGLAVDPNNPDGPKLDQDQYGLAKKIETSHTIQTLLLQDREHAHAVQHQQDEDATKATLGGVIGSLVKDPRYEPTQAEIATIAKTDPLFQTRIAEYRKNVMSNDTVEDPNAKLTLWEDIRNSGHPQDVITQGLGNGTIKTQQTLKEATEWGNLVENTNEKGGAARIQDDPTFKRYLGVIAGNTRDPKWVQSLDGSSGMTLDGRQATQDLTQTAMQWQAAHPTASVIERQKFLSDLGETVMKNVSNQDSQAEGAFKDRKYTPIDPAKALQAASGAAPVAPPKSGLLPQPSPQQNAPVSPAGKQGSADPDGGPVKSWMATQSTPPKFETLQPGNAAMIRATAAKMGMEPQAVLDEMWKRSQPQATPATPEKHGALDNVDKAQTADATATAMDPKPVSFQMPGGGRIDMHGLSPDVQAQITHMAGLMGRLGGGQPQAASPQEPSGSSGVNPTRVSQIDAMPVHSTIEKVAQESGFDPAKLKAMVSIESGGRSGQTTGSYHGLLQLSKAEFAKYGKGGDIENDEDNLRAGVASLQDKAAKFTTQYGREPSATELYLMHQQGEGGLRAHEANPGAPAWENMASTREGQQKGDSWAKQAIWGNVPSDMKRQFGSVDNMTSAEFMAVWQHKLEGTPYSKALAQIKGRSKLADNE